MDLLENCDAEALVFHASLGERVVRVARRLPALKLLVEVDDLGGAGPPPGVADYERIAATHAPAPRMSRSPDDIVMWYSGGTTGLPKGVVIPVGRSVINTGGEKVSRGGRRRGEDDGSRRRLPRRRDAGRAVRTGRHRRRPAAGGRQPRGAGGGRLGAGPARPLQGPAGW